MELKLTAMKLTENISFLNRLTDDYEEEVGRLLHALGEDVVYEAKANVGDNQSIDRGTLLFSIRILDEDLPRSVTVGTDAPYAEYIEFGRGPVKPVNAEYLHFFTKDGKEIFTKFAKATEPQPFLEPAVIKVSGRFRDIFIQGNEDYIKRKGAHLLDTELID